MEIVRFCLHYGMHFLVPGLLAYIFFKQNWEKAWLILIATMLIDVDHLVATPIFDATRCSINYHPLHTYYALVVYVILFIIPKTRIVGLGLLLHILTDFIDCMWL